MPVFIVRRNLHLNIAFWECLGELCVILLMASLNGPCCVFGHECAFEEMSDALHQTIGIENELSQSTKLIWFCFSCGNFFRGLVCLSHHVKTCVRRSGLRSLENYFELHLHDNRLRIGWMDCQQCERQICSAPATYRCRACVHLMRWARLLARAYLQKKTRSYLEHMFDRKHMMSSEVIWAIAAFLVSFPDRHLWYSAVPCVQARNQAQAQMLRLGDL